MPTPRRPDPYRAFNFVLELDGKAVAGFSEVSGLGTEPIMVDYRDGAEKTPVTRKLPRLHKVTSLTLKRGIFKADNDFAAWLSPIKLNTVRRRDVTVNLLNESREPVMV